VKRVLAVSILLSSLGLPQPSLASGQGIDLSAGTLGFAGSLVQPFGPDTDMRFSYGEASFTRTDSFSNLVIDVTANLAVHEAFRVQSVGLYVDRHLRRGPVHVSAGLVYNLNRISGTSIPTNSTVIIGGNAFSQKDAGEIFTVVRWPAIAPYLGIGFGPRAKGPRRSALFGDAGFYYQGRARVEFSATGAIAANYTKFQPYFDEGRRQLTTELAPVQVYPVLQLGVRIPL
jgi:hypothetical protein